MIDVGVVVAIDAFANVRTDQLVAASFERETANRPKPSHSASVDSVNSGTDRLNEFVVVEHSVGRLTGLFD